MSNADLPKSTPEVASPLTGNSTIGRRPVEQPTADQLAMTGHHPRTASSILPVDYLPGTVFGSYQLQEKLGEGGMGTVFKATHLKLKKVMALKILPIEKLRGPETVARFEREMEAVGRVEHPNIVQAYDAGEVNGIHFISMNYIEGSDLSQLVRKKGTLSVTSASKAVRSAALGLAAAHKVGLIHRDIKPSNLLADKQGKILILDLGLALLGDEQSANRTELTAAGTCFGTPDYMAPEQWDDSHAVDPRTDLYALGCTLHFLLVGRAPYETDDYKTMIGKMRAHLDRPIPDLKAARANLPDGLVTIYTKLMAKDAKDRIQTAAELADLLEPFTKKSKSGDESADAGERSGSSPKLGELASGSGISAGAACPFKGDSIFSDDPPARNETVSLSRSDLIPEHFATPSPATEQISITLTPEPPRRRRDDTKSGARAIPKPWLLAGATAFVLLLLAGIIIKITQKDGTVTEIPVPEDAKVEITSTKKKRTTGSNAASKPIENQKSKIENGAIDFAAERKAAERLLRLGKGDIGLGNKDRQDIGELKGPLPVEPIYIRHAVFSGGDIGDAELAALSGCHEIERLDLIDTSATTAGLMRLGPQKRLAMFQCSGAKITDDLNDWLIGCPSLVHLALGSSFTPRGWEGLPDLPNLRSLITSPDVGNSGLGQIVKSCPQLRALTLFDRPDLAPLVGLKRLTTLHCYCDNALSDAGVETLLKLPMLDSLRIDSPDAAGLARLHRLAPKLVELCLRHQNGGLAPSEAWTPATQLPGLRRLLVSCDIAVDGPALTRVAAMPMLKSFGVSDGDTSDATKYRTYTPEDVAAFRKKRPDVELHIGGKIYPVSGPPYSVLQDLDKTDPLAKWELPQGSPPPVVAPCEPGEAAALQQQWAEFLKRPVSEKGPLGMTFALIPPGEFRKIFTGPLGRTIETDMPVRRFRMTQPYAVGTTEVTWDQFHQFVEATGYKTEAETNGRGGSNREFITAPTISWRSPGWSPIPNEPVTQVTPRDAEAFCAWLTKQADSDNQKTKKEGPSILYRLPTEAELVHACRAGSVQKHVVSPDAEDLADFAWTREFLDPNPQASPLHLVAQKKPNPFGLHDTLGNVGERTCDFLSPADAVYLPTNNPFGSRDYGLIDSAWNGPAETQCPDYTYSPQSNPQANVGFRVLKQFDNHPLPGPRDSPLVLRSGQPMSPHSLVPRPTPIAGLRSWSLELTCPQGSTSAIAVSPRGDLVVTGNNFGKLTLWDRDGKIQRVLLGSEGGLGALDISPDGRWLATFHLIRTFEGRGAVFLWNLATGALHARYESAYNNASSGVKFSPDSQQLAVSCDQFQTSMFIVNLATGHRRTPTVPMTWAQGLDWSPDGKHLAASHSDNRLRIWDAVTLTVLRDAECAASGTVAWSPDGKWLALGTEGKVAVRDSATLNLQQTFGEIYSPYCHNLAWFPDNRRIASAGNGSGGLAGVFEAATGKLLAPLNDGGETIALLDQGRQAVRPFSNQLVFYDTTSGEKLRESPPQADLGTPTVLTRDGTLVFGTQFDVPAQQTLVAVSNAATGQQLRRFPLPGNHMTTLPSHDGSLLVTRDWNAQQTSMFVIDAQTGGLRHTLSHGTAKATHGVWSPEGRWLATGSSDGLVRVWDATTGTVAHELAGHTGAIWSVAWSPDGQRLASAAADKSLRLWEPLSGKHIRTYDSLPGELSIELDHGQKLAWASDSRQLWVAMQVHIVPLDVDSGTFGPMERFSNGAGPTFLNASPDGQRLLVREGYGWTYLRGAEADDRPLLGQLLGETVQWLPDSRRFVGSESSWAVAYDTQTKRQLGRLFPLLLGDHWLCIGPTGHYRGSDGVEDQLIYVAQLDDGSQITLSPAEFSKRFNWKNDPEKATLLKLEE